MNDTNHASRAAHWPPRIIYNTDGNWLFEYMKAYRPEDICKRMDNLVDCAVDALSVLVGFDDDLSWRGSKYGQMWGDNVKPEDWRTEEADYFAMAYKLHQALVSVIENGHDLMQIYIDGARQRNLAIYASFRMNDSHVREEARGGHLGRSQMKLDCPDLLIGTPPGALDIGWKFSWKWNYATQEVRKLKLGIFDETLERYDFDGIELDFCREAPFFKPGHVLRNIETMTQFVRDARSVVRRHSARKGRNLRLLVRVPPNLNESLEIGLDTRTWIREGIVDGVAMNGSVLLSPPVDVAEAVACAPSGVCIFTGVGGGTRLASPQEGFELDVPPVIRGFALNGYRQGAVGVHMFNYDSRKHRAGPLPEAMMSDANLWDGGHVGLKLWLDEHKQLLRDLTDPDVLARKNRCYCVTDECVVKNPSYFPGDPRPQVPRKLSLIRRGAGDAHALWLDVEDDIPAGLADGRIKKTELRVRLVDHEKCMDRIVCKINGKPVELNGAPTISNRWADTWICVANPPIVSGRNTILILLDGHKNPDPWPSVEQCEVLVICEE